MATQTYTLDVLWLQEEVCLSEAKGFTLTKNVGRGVIICATPPTQVDCLTAPLGEDVSSGYNVQ
jgi:hypothetical protein